MTNTREIRCPDNNHLTCSFFVGLGRFELPTFGPPDCVRGFHTAHPSSLTAATQANTDTPYTPNHLQRPHLTEPVTSL